MNNWKRFTICQVRDHSWARIAYQPMVSGTEYFLRCQRCGKESHRAVVVTPGHDKWWRDRG